MSHVRCTYCRARRTLRMNPDEYLRLPICPECNGRRKRLGLPIRYTIDRYRQRVERGPNKPKPCRCGEVFGVKGEYPHRPGSGWCVLNPAITDADRDARSSR